MSLIGSDIFNTWPPVGGSVWGGLHGTALLERQSHWGQALRVKTQYQPDYQEEKCEQQCGRWARPPGGSEALATRQRGHHDGSGLQKLSDHQSLNFSPANTRKNKHLSLGPADTWRNNHLYLHLKEQSMEPQPPNYINWRESPPPRNTGFSCSD